MENVNINITLITQDKHEEYNLTGEYNVVDQILNYREVDSESTEMVLDISHQTLTRSQKEYTMHFSFNQKESTDIEIIWTEYNRKTYLKMKTLFWKRESQQVHFKYEILDSQEQIEYIVNYEVKA